MRAIRRAWLAGVTGVAAALAGCASSGAASPGVGAQVRTPAVDEAAQYASNQPTASARMVCSDEIRSEFAAAVGVPTIPAGQSAWADHVYTCTFTAPTGRLVLSVTVTPSTAAAGQRLDQLRQQLPSPDEEPGLGQAGYGAQTGVVVAAKDNMVLSVDATGLPDDIGATHEHRLDLARVIAAGVFNCWSGG
jgi:hypothetical protein